MTNFDFMKAAKWWILLSLIITIAGVISLSTRGLNKSIDFTGGSQITITFDKAGPTQTQVEDAVKGISKVDAPAQQDATDPRVFIVRTAFLDDTQQAQLKTDLQKLGNAAISVDAVDATVSKELTRTAILALIIASVLQILYITFRFEYKFALTAIVAVLHDALITLGLMSVFHAEVGSPFVAAVLTVVGYSINDTVVVFDRIRENLRVRKKEPLRDLVNRSINQVWFRWVLAVSTTLISVLAVFIFGGSTVHDFAMALLIGILSGAYSSIFIASALWYWWKESESKGKAQGKTAST